MTSRKAKPTVPRLDLSELDVTDDLISSNNLDKRVVLNVGGQKHETWLSTLERIPGTRLALLARLQEADDSYDIATGEYFFDRHPRAFDSVLQYYRTEELHVDKGACGNIMKAELKFWGIEESEIEACCWADYSRYTEHKETLRDLDNTFAISVEETWEGPNTGWRKTANKIWLFLEDPASSVGAKIYAITSTFFVALSIAIFVLETHPLFQVDELTGKPMKDVLPAEDMTPTGALAKCCCEPAVNITVRPKGVPHQALTILDYISVCFFTIELLLRFSFCPNKIRFWKKPLNVIDLVCLVPHYVSITLRLSSVNHQSVNDIFKIIVILRVVRILRIFKLMKHYNAFKILVYTIKVSTKELLLMVVFLMSGVLMFASIIHYAEESNFPNIPIAIWWALVTMTTVGYGDKYPVDYIGYGIGSVCVICGVLVIAFTVPIVVNNFSLYYSHAQTRIKIPKSMKRMLLKEKLKSSKFKKQPMKTARKSDVILTSRDITFATIGSQTDRNHQNGSLTQRNTTRQPSNRNTHRVMHGPTSKKSGPGQGVQTVSPVEVSDIESCDSGYMELNKKKIEEETQEIIDNMADADRKRNEERKRQEAEIKKKREERNKRKPKDK